jgi:hypothetical protein
LLVSTRLGPIVSPFRTSIWEAQGSTASLHVDAGRVAYSGGGWSAPWGTSRISLFVRDVSAILLNDASAFHESWALPDSGGREMTSLRHSVSFVQLGRYLSNELVLYSCPS